MTAGGVKTAVRAGCLALVVWSTHAVWNAAAAQELGQEFEQQEWKEQVTHLPAFPVPQNLIRTHVGVPNSFEFFVDPKSLDVGTDGIVRVTIVARSPAGAENITFEGFHCSARERKIYAVGRADKTWAQARNPNWSKITGNQRNPYLADLNDHYFCPEFAPTRDKDQTLVNLREGKGEGMQYPAGVGGPQQ